MSNDAKWLCPQCGTTGVSSTAWTPNCHRCDFLVEMVQISDRFYNTYHYALWCRGEMFRSGLASPGTPG